ncbi:MAG: hypothetical protein JWR34_7403 [Mycobacterium sp.]|nr:hypothetical protein [Mycobacterium sp.]
MTNWDITSFAAKLFGGEQPPDRDEYVLNQGFVRDLDKCRNLLPDEVCTRMWPQEFDTGLDDGTRRRIDRRSLFGIAQRAASDSGNPWAAAQLHAAITFWGAPPGMPMQRACRPLGEAGAAANLTKVLHTVRGEGATSAYKAMVRGGRLAVKGLGPSYLTKLLYFGGYGAKPHMPDPLIMDDNVIKGLVWLTEEPWEQTVAAYGQYLDLAADLASELGSEPDVIERRLFELGESG